MFLWQQNCEDFQSNFVLERHCESSRIVNYSLHSTLNKSDYFFSYIERQSGCFYIEFETAI